MDVSHYPQNFEHLEVVTCNKLYPLCGFGGADTRLASLNIDLEKLEKSLANTKIDPHLVVIRGVCFEESSLFGRLSVLYPNYTAISCMISDQ